MQRSLLALAIGLLVSTGAGCDIVKETIEQTITEQSIRVGDQLEEVARAKADEAREGAISAAFGGGEEATSAATGDAAAAAGGPAKKPNDETFDEFN